MYLFFPTFGLNLVFALNCFSFLSQIQDDAKVEFTALKRSLEPADNEEKPSSCAYSEVNWVQQILLVSVGR